MDRKSIVILKHYKNFIENRLFDEYDILGFLIFIRYLLCKKNHRFITEITDLIAHRERDRGIVVDNIGNAIKNNYKEKNKKVQGYEGVQWEDILNEWFNLGKQFKINLDESIIKEIMLCIFSLMQDTQYIVYDNQSNTKKCVAVGKIELIISGKELCLITTDQRYLDVYVAGMRMGSTPSPNICLSKIGDFEIVDERDFITEIVETERLKTGQLILKSDKGVILRMK